MRYRPCLHNLEDRTLLTTVTNLEDVNLFGNPVPGSLRDALASTPAGGTINFEPGLTGTINLNGGILRVVRDVTINGPGRAALLIDGGGTWDVTATDTQSGISGTTNVNVMAASASQFVVSTDAANSDIAGTVFDVTVVATDPYGNTDTNYTGTVHFSSQDPYGASLPADYAFQPSDQGVATFSGVTALYTAGHLGRDCHRNRQRDHRQRLRQCASGAGRGSANRGPGERDVGHAV